MRNPDFMHREGNPVYSVTPMGRALIEGPDNPNYAEARDLFYRAMFTGETEVPTLEEFETVLAEYRAAHLRDAE